MKKYVSAKPFVIIALVLKWSYKWLLFIEMLICRAVAMGQSYPLILLNFHDNTMMKASLSYFLLQTVDNYVFFYSVKRYPKFSNWYFVSREQTWV